LKIGFFNYDRYIDIQIEISDKHDRVKVFTDLSYRFLHDKDFEDIKLIHCTPGKKLNMPAGMYMGLHCKHDNTRWKIDIWALDDVHFKENRQYMQDVLSKLNNDRKKLILEWKHKMLTNGRVPQLGSYMLYRAILFEELTDNKKIADYLVKNGVKFTCSDFSVNQDYLKAAGIIDNKEPVAQPTQP